MRGFSGITEALIDIDHLTLQLLGVLIAALFRTT